MESTMYHYQEPERNLSLDRAHEITLIRLSLKQVKHYRR